MFQVMSDLHLEFHRDGGRSFVESLSPAAPRLILAGDIFQWSLGPNCREAFEALCSKYESVVYVPGNHEYYGGSISDIGPDWMWNIPNIETGNPFVVEYDDYMVVAATMWFRYEEPDRKFAGLMRDFYTIRGIDDQIATVARDQREHIVRQLSSVPTGKPWIVVTHHAPSFLSVHPRFAADETNRFFVTDMEESILENPPRFWVHGHMHDRFRYRIGSCEVVCNPLGYPGQVTGYHEDLIIG